VIRKHNILVVADEIYGLLTYGGEQASMASVCPEHTIISSGISKWLGAGGWRLGAFIFPSELLWLSDAMGAAASETFSAVSAPVQHASIVAYQGSAEIQDFLRRSNRVLSVVSRFTSRRLHASGVQFADPQGGFYIFPQFSLTEQAAQSRNITDSPSLAAALLEEIGVLGLAASYFGRPTDELRLRLAPVDYDGGEALERIDQLATDSDVAADDIWVESVAPRVFQGVIRLSEWAGAVRSN